MGPPIKVSVKFAVISSVEEVEPPARRGANLINPVHYVNWNHANALAI
jgi:hypothetical protein